MKKIYEKILYTDEPVDVYLERARRIKGFLLPPGDLTFREERVVTMRLDEMTIRTLLMSI